MDPITIGLLIQAGTTAYGALQSQKREKEYNAVAAEQRDKREQARQAISEIDFSPGSGIYELEQERKLAAELRGADALRSQDETTSRAISALSEDPRNVASLLRIQDQDKSDQILARQGQQKTEATAQTVKAEETARQQQTALDKELAMMDYNEAVGTETAYTQGALSERANREQMLIQTAGDFAETAVTAGARNKKNTPEQVVEKVAEGSGTAVVNENNVAATDTKAAEVEAEIPDYTAILDNAYDGSDTLSNSEIDAANSRELDRFANQQLIESYGDGPFVDPLSPEGVLLEQNLQDSKYGINMYGDGRAPLAMELGGSTLIPTADGDYFVDDGVDFADGGRTEGEYDHNTNKKAIVDEESGEKQGEMTGDEFILPKYFVEDVEEIREKIKEAEASGDDALVGVRS